MAVAVVQRGNGSGGTGGTLGAGTGAGNTLVVYVVSNSATRPTITTTGSATLNLTPGWWSVAGHNGDYTGVFYLLNTPAGITGYTTSGIYASYYREFSGIPVNPIVYWNYGGNATAGTVLSVPISGYAVAGDLTTDAVGYDVTNSGTARADGWTDVQTCSNYGQSSYTTAITAGSGTLPSSGTYDDGSITFKTVNQAGLPPVNWSAVAGTFVYAYGTSGQSTIAVTPQQVGNLIAVYTKISSTTIWPTGISGPGTGSWQQALTNFNDGASQLQNAWIGTVTATGATNLTFTFNSAIGTTAFEVCVQEFNPGTGATFTYTLDGNGTKLNSTAGNFHTWPTMTPTTVSGELLVGFARVPGLPGLGTLSIPSAPTVVQQDSNNNPFIYALNLVSAFTPQMWDSTSAASYCSAFLVIANPQVSPADRAGAVEQVAISAAVPLADTAGAADQLAVSAAVPVADAAAAVDSFSVVVTVPQTEADAAGATDKVAVTAATPLAEAAAAVESLSVAVTLPVADVAAAADAETVAAAVPLAETAGAVESQAIRLTQADAAAAVDALASAVAIPLPDVAAAAEAIVAGSFQWIQSGSAQSALTTSITKTYATNLSSGTKLIALVGCSTTGGADTTTSVHDSQATPNQMVKLGAQALSNNEGEISLWAMDTPAADVGTKPTITATCSASGSGMAIMVCEVGGLAVGNTVAAMLDGAIAWVSGTALGTLASPSYTSSNPGEFLIAFYGDWGNPTTWTNPAGFQGATAGPGTAGAATGIQNSQEDALEIAYKKSTGGAETAQYSNTGTAGPWLVGMVAFLPAVTATATTEADAGAGTDQIAVSAAVPLPEAAGAAESLSVSVAVPVVDAAGAAESAAIAVTAPLTDAAAAADRLAPSAAVALADQAAAVESQLIGVPQADAAAAAESLSVTVTTALADTAASSEASAVAASLGVVDQAAAAESAGVTATVPLADQAGGADSAAATVAVPLADRAAAVEQQVIGIGQADAAGAADQVTVQAAAPLAEAAGAADAISVAVGQVISQADTAAATEAISASAAVPLPELAAAVESLSVVVSVSLSETAGAAESNIVAVTTALQDQAAAVESQAIAVSAADAAGAVDALTVQVTVALADQAAAAEAIVLGAPVSFADAGAGSEAVAITATVPEADAAAGSDTVAVTAAASLAEAAGAAESISVAIGNVVTPADAAAATDSLSVQVTAPLGDAGASADTLAAAVALSLADQAGAVDTESVAIGGQAVSVADTGAAADQLTAAVSVPDADVAAGADALSISAQVPAPEQAAAAEQLAVTASTSVADAAGAAETLSVLAVQPVTEADAAAAVDAISVVVSVPLADRAGSVEQSTASVILALSDVSGATDRVLAQPVVTYIAPTEWTAHPWPAQWHAEPMTTQWAARPELAQWRAEIFPSQWHAEPGPTQWIAEPERPQWRVEMQDFDPVAAISTEMVNIRWTSDLDGTVIDPTISDPCTYAMPVSSGDVSHPAEPSQWYTGEWLIGGKGKGFIEQCTVGPSTSGPTLTAGTKYDVWGSVAGVRKFVGVLSVY